MPGRLPGMLGANATHVCIGIAFWGARSASYAANMPGIKLCPQLKTTVAAEKRNQIGPFCRVVVKGSK